MAMLWVRDRSEEMYTRARLDDPTQFRGLSLYSGKPVFARFPPNVRITVLSAEPTDFFEVGPLPVVSGNLASILQRHDTSAELLPVSVVDQNGVESGRQWHCLNILEVIDCVDVTKSQFVENERNIVRRLVLTSAADGPSPLFLIANMRPPTRCIRDDVARDIIRATCTGVLFKTAAEWRNPMW